ncbi:MAG: hypothetical protein HYT87_12965 [Nitrospirae bacterium]|nr:hypothetical protein [Nitrospirota bacterium]
MKRIQARSKAGSRRRRHQCENCGRRLTDAGIIPLREMSGLTERLSAGEIVPSGECRRCGAVTHLVESPINDLVKAAREGLYHLEGVYDTTSDEDYGGRSQVRQSDLRTIQMLRRALGHFA